MKTVWYREVPFKRRLFDPPPPPPAVPAQWAFRRYLMAEEGLAPFIWGHESLTYRNHTSFISWATALSWGSPQSPGWHINPATQVFIAPSVLSKIWKRLRGNSLLEKTRDSYSYGRKSSSSNKKIEQRAFPCSQWGLKCGKAGWSMWRLRPRAVAGL